MGNNLQEVCEATARTDWERNNSQNFSNSYYLHQRESPGMDPSTGYITGVLTVILTVFSIFTCRWYHRSNYCYGSTESCPCLTLSGGLPSYWISQSLSHQNSSSHDRRLQEILETNLLEFVAYTNWNLLSPLLISQHLLDPDEHCSVPEDEMVSHFYTKILPLHERKDNAYLRLYYCLQEEDKHHAGSQSTCYNLQ